MTVNGSDARRLWQLFEPIHAIVYFAPEKKQAYDDAGLRGGWMGYFASRAAAMGAVPADVVVATFYNFHPRMVHRAIPDAWRFSTPERVLEARRAIVDAALRRVLGDVGGEDVKEAAEAARAIADRCDAAGRALYGAHASLPWPEAPHMSLWHAATLLREHRGDGHVAALLTAGIDGCEANLTMALVSGVEENEQRENRGWSAEEWSDARERLRARGWVDDDGLTDAGRGARASVEDQTDELAAQPYRAAGPEACARLEEALKPVVARIYGGDAMPYPNPMGLERARNV